VTALIGVAQAPGSDVDELIATLSALPEVESCYFLAGDESFQLQARVGTIAELESLVVRLSHTPGVARTRTTIVLSTKWEGRPRPLRAVSS
jgi:Lrp/AsnC family leucine-responsive transcriptional regulator